eukprot:SAG11_NODE_3002_length_2776_cov_1.699290_4_plen_77_part_00
MAVECRLRVTRENVTRRPGINQTCLNCSRAAFRGVGVCALCDLCAHWTVIAALSLVAPTLATAKRLVRNRYRLNRS